MANDAEIWQKRFERERAARKSAEKLLEEKSLEIWEINQNLEHTIIKRTEELQKALLEAESANRAKDAFLSSMSHELRTPLNAIIGFAQILMVKSDTHPASKTFIEKIQIAGKSLLNVVNTLLDFSKIESGKMDYRPDVVSVATLFKETEAICEPLLIKKKLSLHFDTIIDHLVGDPTLLKQGLINLVSNAIKFSPPHGTITISCSVLENAIQLSVRDEGDGIEPDKISTLFQPFSQLSNANYIEEAGTGLGLMIVKKIAEIHGGDVGVTSNVPKGTLFWILIPQSVVKG